MPGFDGFEIAEDLHDLNLRDNLLVAMTIYSDEAHRREAESCGFDLFLPKPPAYEEIADVIEIAKARFSDGSTVSSTDSRFHLEQISRLGWRAVSLIARC